MHVQKERAHTGVVSAEMWFILPIHARKIKPRLFSLDCFGISVSVSLSRLTTCSCCTYHLCFIPPDRRGIMKQSVFLMLPADREGYGSTGEYFPLELMVTVMFLFQVWQCGRGLVRRPERRAWCCNDGHVHVAHESGSSKVAARML